MDLEALKEQYEEDILWEFSEIPVFVSTIPIKIAKYQNLWFKLRNQYDNLDKDASDLWISRFMWYKQEFDISLTNTEIKLFLEKDKVLNDIKIKQRKLITIIEWLEKSMKNLDSMRWDLKLAVQYQEFVSGKV